MYSRYVSEDEMKLRKWTPMYVVIVSGESRVRVDGRNEFEL